MLQDTVTREQVKVDRQIPKEGSAEMTDLVLQLALNQSGDMKIELQCTRNETSCSMESKRLII